MADLMIVMYNYVILLNITSQHIVDYFNVAAGSLWGDRRAL